MHSPAKKPAPIRGDVLFLGLKYLELTSQWHDAHGADIRDETDPFALNAQISSLFETRLHNRPEGWRWVRRIIHRSPAFAVMNAAHAQTHRRTHYNVYDVVREATENVAVKDRDIALTSQDIRILTDALTTFLLRLACGEIADKNLSAHL